MTGMKLWLVIAILSGGLLGCQALLDPAYPQLVADVTAKVQEIVATQADAGDILTDEEVRALVVEVVEAHTQGTPLEGAGAGALATAVLGLIAKFIAESRKNSRKRGEIWAEIEAAKQQAKA